MKHFIIFLTALALFCSCAKDKTFTRKDGSTITAVPYGLFNERDTISNVQYRVCVPNLVLDAVFSESVFVPIILVGTQLYEPVNYIEQ